MVGICALEYHNRRQKLQLLSFAVRKLWARMNIAWVMSAEADITTQSDEANPCRYP